MAKISTYPQPTPPQLSDYVIGTDISDALMTKNFLLSDILNLATTTGQFVTVAEAQTVTGLKTFSSTVNLTNSLSVNGAEGTSGQMMVSNGPSVAPSWKTLSKGHFLSTDDQPYILNPLLPDGMYVSFNTTVSGETNGITLSDDKFTFQTAGIYRLSLYLGVNNSNSLFFNSTCNVWLMKNGVNIPYNNRIFSISPLSNMLFSVDYSITVAENDFIKVGFSTLGEDISLAASPSDLYYPAAPSAVMIINKI